MRLNTLFAVKRSSHLLLSLVVTALLGAGCNNGPANTNAATASLTPSPLTDEGKEFFKAVEGGDMPRVRELVQQNPQLLGMQGDMGTALHRTASGTGDAQMAAILLKAGANPNALDDRGNTPLNIAVRGKGTMERTRVVDVLLSNGADPNAKTRGGKSTPLHIAAYAGNINTVRLLIAHKADLKATDSNGKTPLQLVKSVQAKYKAGDPEILQISGFFAMENYPQIIQMMTKAGGK